MIATTVSVVIPTFRRRALIFRLLQSLQLQRLPAEQYEVIVSIDGSDDGTYELVEQFACEYRLLAIWQPNSGRAAACNAAIRRARNDLIVILDDDMLATPGLLVGHLQEHIHTGIAVTGAAPLLPPADASPTVKMSGRRFNQRLRRFAEAGSKLRYYQAYSGNFSIERALMQQIGGFDQQFRLYGYEDYELALRLEQLGVALRYSVAALAIQTTDKELPALARDSQGRGYNAVRFIEKHPEAIGDLKVARDTAVSLRQRQMRTLALAITRRFAPAAELIRAGLNLLAQLDPTRIELYHDRLMDYSYWCGVQTALDENARSGSGIQSLPELRRLAGI